MNDGAIHKILEAIESSREVEPATPESRAATRAKLMAKVLAGENIMMQRNESSDSGVVHDYYNGGEHLGYLEGGDDNKWDAYLRTDDPETYAVCLNKEPTSYVQAFTILEEAIYG